MSGLATEFSSAQDSPGFLLWQVTNRWQAAIRAALKPLGLTHVQFVLLASLAWLDADGAVTQRALANHAAVDPMMCSQVLRALADRFLRAVAGRTGQAGLRARGQPGDDEQQDRRGDQPGRHEVVVGAGEGPVRPRSPRQPSRIADCRPNISAFSAASSWS